MKALRWCLTMAVVAMLAAPQPLAACAVCYGKSDSDLARGMNWGILSLLAVVVFVLGGIASFFVYLARRAAMTSGAATTTLAAAPEPSKPL